MDKNIQNTIVEQSERLFRENGYNKTSMRQIADACSIAVGNLCYYFPKKEDLLMVHHNHLMNSFYEQVVQNLSHQNPWISYFATEYSFLHKMAFDPQTYGLYKEVINLPVLRNEYYKKHHELFLEIFSDVDLSDIEQELYLSNIAMCSLEYQLIEQYDSFTEQWEFDHVIENIFKTRLLFLNKDWNDFTDIIQEAIKLAKTIC